MKETGSAYLSRTQGGQSLVELAISLTVILLLLSGAVDFGMALFSYTALRDAAQEGALYASFNGNGTNGALDSTYIANIRERVRTASSNPVNLSALSDSQITVQLTNGGGTYCEGLTGSASNGVQVTVGPYEYPIIMPYIGAIIGRQTIPLQATVIDTILQPTCPSP